MTGGYSLFGVVGFLILQNVRPDNSKCLHFLSLHCKYNRMPQFNAFHGSQMPWGWAGSQLVTHAHKRARDWHDDHSAVSKSVKLSDYGGVKRNRDEFSMESSKRMAYGRRSYRPRYRRPSRRYRKRRFVRRRRPYRMRYRIRNFHPREMVVRCRVASEYVLTCTTGGKAQLNLRTNDIIDPFGSGGAEQPLHYDTWKAMYAKAIVIGYKATIQVENTGTVAVLMACRLLSDDEQTGTSYASVDHLVEAGCKKVLLSPEFDKCTIVRKCSPRKQSHVRSLRDDSNYHIDLDAETAPTTLLYDHIAAQPIDKTTSANIQMFVTVEYIVLLFDRNVVSRSTGV